MSVGPAPPYGPDMSTRLARSVTTVVLGLVALGLAALAALVVYGVTVEYGGGFASSDLVLFVGLPVVVSLLAALAWPRRGALPRLVAATAFAIVVVASLGGATVLGERQNRILEQQISDDFACPAPVDPRVDDAFAALPRPVPIYGPVESSRRDCVAGISGGEESVEEFRRALRASDWRVVRDEPRQVVARRDGVRATVYVDAGSGPDLQPLLRLSLE